MIEQIGIYNYKSIREATIPLRKINVLIGENGAGKSNFISFFEMVKALYDQRLGSYMLSNGGVDAQLYRGRKCSDAINGIIDYNNEYAIGKLAAMIRKASFKSKIIVATQSVNLIDHFEIDDLILVGRRDNQSVFIRPKERPRFRNWVRTLIEICKE